MSRADQVCHHALVERVDGITQLVGEFGKGLANRLDLSPDQVLEALGKFRVRFTGLVVELCAFEDARV